jgi:prophage antirepressor-like protein
MASAIVNNPVETINPVPFAFESHQIRTVINGDGIPWFVARDVATTLGVAWSGHTLDSIPADWQRMVKLTTLRRGAQQVKAISEPAVYKLAFRSNKPEADRFTNWVASEVIPALRRQGKYEACPTPETPRLTTAKERNALTTLVNRYVGLLPGDPNQEAYKTAWRKVHDVMGIKAIEELSVEQLPRAVVLMESLIAGLGPKTTLPAATPAVVPLAGLESITAVLGTLRDARRMTQRLNHNLHRAALDIDNPQQSMHLAFVLDELAYAIGLQTQAVESVLLVEKHAIRASMGR